MLKYLAVAICLLWGGILLLSDDGVETDAFSERHSFRPSPIAIAAVGRQPIAQAELWASTPVNHGIAPNPRSSGSIRFQRLPKIPDAAPTATPEENPLPSATDTFVARQTNFVANENDFQSFDFGLTTIRPLPPTPNSHPRQRYEKINAEKIGRDSSDESLNREVGWASGLRQLKRYPSIQKGKPPATTYPKLNQ